MRYIKGILYCWLWYTSILSGYYVLYCPLLPLILVSNRIFRKYTDTIFRCWELFPTAMLTYFFGTKFIITGDKIRYDDMAVIVMNHRTRTDWNFLWPIVYHANTVHHHRMKFILKDVIKHIPGPGWVMEMTCFLFIQRKWEADKFRIKRLAQYLSIIGHKCQLLLFPEGTDLTPHTISKSHKFAEKDNLQKYQYVLHPRTTGFSYLVNQLQRYRHFDAVYDLTLGYPDIIPQTEKHIALGQIPKEVHCHIKRYPKELLPTSEPELKDFLNDRWKDKEVLLKSFYENGHFESKTFLQDFSKLNLILPLIFWTALPPITWFFLINNTFLQLMFCFSTSLLLFFNTITDGFQEFEISFFFLKTFRDRCIPREAK